ncbi:unnamed protein product [Peronospora farinosa]|uniref:Uncharacterized protein n=1 Tax=Peronospora farinosa TaxID=134698 RepID=A0AAV0TR23_9STRA|nr:unnamed protein product [Peronospora farinosa]CAI5725612.1 unnamed protein product [Peronospora farinosa]
MGAVNCCAQTASDVDAWKTGTRCRTLSRGEAKELMPMYDYEPSLSLDLEDRASNTDGGGMAFSPGTPISTSIRPDLEDNSIELVAGEGVVAIHKDLKEQEMEMSSEARALLPAPNSCPRSGINLRGRQSPTLGSNKSHASTPRRTQSFGEAPQQLRLEDYLCTCKHCPRAMTIQRAFQLYGFALDHPHSDALLHVLRACANYDETIVEVDPILVLHAEKMLEELNFDENETFRLLVASHFKHL